MELFRRLSARHPNVAEGHYALGSAALRADNFALALASATKAAVARAVLDAGEDAARARADRQRQGRGGSRDSRATLVTDPESDVAMHLEYAMLLAATRSRRGSARDAHAVRERQDGRARRGACARRLLDLRARQSRCREHALRGMARDRRAIVRGAVLSRRRSPSGARTPTRAVRYYSRVTGGDYALPAQQRVARIKAEQVRHRRRTHAPRRIRRARSRRCGPDVVAAQRGLLSEHGRREAARSRCSTTGSSSIRTSIDLRMARVFLYERTGHVDAAIRDLRALLAERPGDATIQNALGYTLADHDAPARRSGGADRSGAGADARQRGRARQHGLGCCTSRASTARRSSISRSARKLGTDPEIDLHLGEVQWASRRQDGGAQDVAESARALARRQAAQGAAGARRALKRGLVAAASRCSRQGARRHRATVVEPPPAIDATAAQSWTAQGRLAVAVAGQGGSGSFDWRAASPRARSSRCAGRSASAPSDRDRDGDEVSVTDGQGVALER